MTARPDRRGAALTEGGLAALAEAGLALGLARDLQEATRTIAEASVRALEASVVVIRVLDEKRDLLLAAAVAADSAAVAAELEGSRISLPEVPEHEEFDPERLPEAVRRAAERVRASAALLIPVRVDGRIAGTVEVMREGSDFDESELQLARLVAGQSALSIRAFRTGPDDGRLGRETVLALAGEALAAGADDSRMP